MVELHWATLVLGIVVCFIVGLCAGANTSGEGF